MVNLSCVTKIFGKNAQPAVDCVNINFESNKIYGLLGRNGAGKTTLINLIAGRLFPTSGEITVDGMRATENDYAQEKVFCMTEKGRYSSELNGKACFRWAAEFYPHFDSEYANRLAKEFKLDLKKRIRTLSTGYGSILKLIMTLSSGAEVMIFDEPTLGLDAGMREIFYRLLLEKYEEVGNTMIISTHYIGEISDILERVIIIDSGKIIVDSDVEELTSCAYIISGAKKKVEAFVADKKVLHIQSIGGFISVTIDEKLDAVVRKNAEAAGFDISAAKLQDLFIKLTDDKEGVQ